MNEEPTKAELAEVLLELCREFDKGSYVLDSTISKATELVERIYGVDWWDEAIGPFTPTD
jgi:hypothetical protein